jgi:hypothetical protein
VNDNNIIDIDIDINNIDFFFFNNNLYYSQYFNVNDEYIKIKKRPVNMKIFFEEKHTIDFNNNDNSEKSNYNNDNNDNSEKSNNNNNTNDSEKSNNNDNSEKSNNIDFFEERTFYYNEEMYENTKYVYMRDLMLLNFNDFFKEHDIEYHLDDENGNNLENFGVELPNNVTGRQQDFPRK